MRAALRTRAKTFAAETYIEKNMHAALKQRRNSNRSLSTKLVSKQRFAIWNNAWLAGHKYV